MARTAFILRMVRYGGIAAALMGSVAGCATQCGSCKKGCDGRFKSWSKDLDPAVQPQPLGTFVNGWREAQHTKAEASDFVLSQMAPRLSHASFARPIHISPS